VTTADEALAAKVEPGAPPPVRRFAALEKLAEAGIKTGVLLMPVLPFLEDSEKNVTDVVNRAADKGARFVYAYFGVTLRQNQREWYYAALERIAPGLKERYAARYGERYSCLSPKASRLKEAFEAACERRGLLWTMPAIIQDYQLPYRTDQMTLFE
jgi:DNA repair photolyase